jgi:hypothetical protein
MACAISSNYNLDCRDSRGGVFTAFVIEHENVTSMTVASGVVTALVKAEGKQFRKYNLIAHTGEGTQELTGSREAGSLSTKQTVKFPINKMTVAVRNEILLLAQNRLIWVLTDNNGNSWLFGYKFGLTLSAAPATLGKALADRNGVELTFEGDEPEYALHVQSSVVAELETPGE